MYWTTALSTATLLAPHTLAEIIPLPADPSIHAGSSGLLQHHAQDMSSQYISRRQSSPEDETQGAAPLTPDGSMDWDAWDSRTVAACMQALGRLDTASNPSGTSICYNLPMLNRTSGIFGADLRLFKVSEPSGSWVNIPPENIEVTVGFRGAAVSAVDPNRGEAQQQQQQQQQQNRVKRQDNAGQRNRTTELLQTYFFIGQIGREHMEANMTSAEIEALVMPILTLSATNPDGVTLTTNVSSNEAAFLTGVFSDEENLSDFTRADRAVANITRALENAEVAFVLPGVQILIFPIGLVIIAVWTLIGVAAYGFGTYERVQYAESFKRRQALAGNARSRI
ncbi:hypothetical protein SODALDRAFT_318758 [Sodiomyces alkalinus F11]|uniref:Uncharacterized protein n=1 Tax=Sodiomyces alkalinus (strain CBS 110278 / VKM F-3762 / F11) TaxID=1314773 RepID=A0A3N2Q5P4_SODAK|nr:hypothetical protein SODALDRAFT_318758 [Sodiomyces alkalinus F11]ROT41978.1 hypothetical protein SODALDRAFT_318758 [Sodiomyces alkalinus F11]